MTLALSCTYTPVLLKLKDSQQVCQWFFCFAITVLLGNLCPLLEAYVCLCWSLLSQCYRFNVLHKKSTQFHIYILSGFFPPSAVSQSYADTLMDEVRG